MDVSKDPKDEKTFWWATGKTSLEGGIEEEERRWSDGSPTGATRWTQGGSKEEEAGQ